MLTPNERQAAGGCVITRAASPPKSKEPRDKDNGENWMRLDLLLNLDALENPDPALKKAVEALENSQQ